MLDRTFRLFLCSVEPVFDTAAILHIIKNSGDIGSLNFLKIEIHNNLAVGFSGAAP